MEKANRARGDYESHQQTRAVVRRAVHEALGDPYGLSDTPLQMKANQVLDLMHLIDAARFCGLRNARAARWRAAIEHGHDDVSALTRWESRLQQWITRSG